MNARPDSCISAKVTVGGAKCGTMNGIKKGRGSHQRSTKLPMIFERFVAVHMVTSSACTHRKKPKACTVISNSWAYIIAVTIQKTARLQNKFKIKGPSWPGSAKFSIQGWFRKDILSQCSYSVLGSASKADRTRKVFGDTNFLIVPETSARNRRNMFALSPGCLSGISPSPFPPTSRRGFSSVLDTFCDGKPTRNDPNSMMLFQTVEGWG
mmetsp:Transcript_24516/g.61078  ORF Transcript_24516/g.61078 Transcript_24516/m.61078 type:complete len:210 (-) Transcript_24516:5293-5922(-)